MWPHDSHRGRCTAAAAIVAALLSGAPSATGEPALDHDGATVERLLERLRREREERLGPLRVTVLEIVLELESVQEGLRKEVVSEQRARMIALGTSAAPLLVPWIEPERRADPGGAGGAGAGGAEARAARVFRAAEVALALRELPTPATTDDLLHHARRGSPETRRNAVLALSSSPEPERVRPVLREIYEKETGELRRDALETLASFPGSADLFVLALEDEELVEIALAALANTRNTQAAGHVVGVLASPSGARYLSPVITYFRAVPEVLDDDTVQAVAQVLMGSKLAAGAKVQLLDALADLDVKLDRKAREGLDPLTRSSSSQVAEGALVLLARQRDTKARRRLLQPYDDAVERNEDRPTVHTRRAHVFYRIGDMRAAIKDYKRALELGRSKGIDEAPFIGLARCYALTGKFKDAAEYLDRAPVSVATLQALAKDPDFAEMVKDKRGREAFHLPEADEN